MFHVRRIIGITLLICVFMFPTSVFASTDKHSGNTKNNENKQQSSFTQVISFFSGNKGHNNSSDYLWDNDWDDKKDNNKDLFNTSLYDRDWDDYHSYDKDWLRDKLKDCLPSLDIWKKWICY